MLLNSTRLKHRDLVIWSMRKLAHVESTVNCGTCPCRQLVVTFPVIGWDLATKCWSGETWTWSRSRSSHWNGGRWTRMTRQELSMDFECKMAVCIRVCVCMPNNIYFYLCINVSSHPSIHPSIYLSYLILSYLIYLCMYACMHACMHVCMYVCLHTRYIYQPRQSADRPEQLTPWGWKWNVAASRFHPRVFAPQDSSRGDRFLHIHNYIQLCINTYIYIICIYIYVYIYIFIYLKFWKQRLEATLLTFWAQ